MKFKFNFIVRNEIGAKAVHKMLLKLSIGGIQTMSQVKVGKRPSRKMAIAGNRTRITSRKVDENHGYNLRWKLWFAREKVPWRQMML
jgi:hypothetical protein